MKYFFVYTRSFTQQIPFKKGQKGTLCIGRESNPGLMLSTKWKARMITVTLPMLRHFGLMSIHIALAKWLPHIGTANLVVYGIQQYPHPGHWPKMVQSALGPNWDSTGTILRLEATTSPSFPLSHFSSCFHLVLLGRTVSKMPGLFLVVFVVSYVELVRFRRL
jgi:hypothetical protein